MKKLIIIAVIAVVAIAGAIYLFSDKSPAPVANVESSAAEAPYPGNPVPQPPAPSAPTTTPESATQPPPPANQVTITFTDNGPSPADVTIPKGGTVVFVNNSSDAIWPASNPHPIHTEYPQSTGICKASDFDACGLVPSGSSYSFTFDIPGSWGWHNHLNPGQGGTITVQ